MIDISPSTLNRLGQSVGTSGFHQACHAVMAELVPHDARWIVIYRRVGRPRVLKYELAPAPSVSIDRNRVLALYEMGFFRFDPFFRYWRDGGEPGVAGMHEVPVPPSRENTYLSDFMPVTRMADEVGLFLPVSDLECIALTLDRATIYAAHEFKVLRNLYPLLAGLNESHFRIAAWNEERVDRERPTTPLDFELAVAGFTAGDFTPREREIVHLILGGYTNDAIARHIGISTGTVRNHRKRLYVKLDVTTEREIFSLFLGHLADMEPGELV